MKICNRCEQEKEISEFYARDNTCKECRKALVRANRLENAERYRAYDKKRYREDPKVRERHKRYAATDKGRESISRAKAKYIQVNPVKRAAHVILGNALRDGKIEKPSICEACGKSGQTHGHHDDYALPLVVRWLCPKCHADWHAEHGEAANG